MQFIGGAIIETLSEQERRCSILLISCFNSLNGEGLSSDLQTSIQHQTIPRMVQTGIFYQDRKKNEGLFPLPPQIFAIQLEQALREGSINALKMGVLYSKAFIKILIQTLARKDLSNIVIDPVLISRQGFPLLEKNAYTLFFHKLIPMADMITPNLHEAEAMTGKKITHLSEAYKTAEHLHRITQCSVLIKGGHFDSPTSTDILFDGQQFYTYESPRKTGALMPGVGAMLSTAIACNLAKNMPHHEAVLQARKYVEKLGSSN